MNLVMYGLNKLCPCTRMRYHEMNNGWTKHICSDKYARKKNYTKNSQCITKMDVEN